MISNKADSHFESLPFLTKNLKRIDRAILQSLPPRNLSKISKAIHYSVLNGGKRIRPQLVLLMAEALKIDVKPKTVDLMAASGELIHCYSLIHDDLPSMDDDDYRRGKLSCHMKFNEATAILAGDAIQPLALEILTTIKDDKLEPEQKLKIINLFAKACGPKGMVEGQSRDLDAEGKKIKLEELDEIHNLKTGKLIQACVESICILKKDLPKEHLRAFKNFAKKFGLAFLDISTGDFHATEGTISQMKLLLEHFSPEELLVPKPQKKAFLEQFETALHCFYLDDWAFEESTAKTKLLDHFDILSLEGFGIGQSNLGVAAAGAVLHYLSETHHEKLQHITRLLPIQQTKYVGLDPFTARNLELFQPTHAGGVALIDVIDYTKTAMGGRLLRHWLAFPLLNLDAIEKRHEVIATLLANEELKDTLQQMLQHTIDIERIMAKIATEKISPRALVQLQHSLTLSLIHISEPTRPY